MTQQGLPTPRINYHNNASRCEWEHDVGSACVFVDREQSAMQPSKAEVAHLTRDSTERIAAQRWPRGGGGADSAGRVPGGHLRADNYPWSLPLPYHSSKANGTISWPIGGPAPTAALSTARQADLADLGHSLTRSLTEVA